MATTKLEHANPLGHLPLEIRIWMRPGVWVDANSSDPITEAIDARDRREELANRVADYHSRLVESRAEAWNAFDVFRSQLVSFADGAPDHQAIDRAKEWACSAMRELLNYETQVRQGYPFDSLKPTSSVLNTLRCVTRRELPSSALVAIQLLILAATAPDELYQRLCDLHSRNVALLRASAEWLLMFAVLLAPPDGPSQALRPDGTWIDVSVELTRGDREGGAVGSHGVMDAFIDVYRELTGAVNVETAHADMCSDTGSSVDGVCLVSSESDPRDRLDCENGSASTDGSAPRSSFQTDKATPTITSRWRVHVPKSYEPAVGILVDGMPFQVSSSVFKLLAEMSNARENDSVMTKSKLDKIVPSALATLNRLKKKIVKKTPNGVCWIVKPGKKNAGGYRIL